MDSELLLVIPAFLLLISSPILIAFSVTGCIAWSNTRKWKKEKAQRRRDSEYQNLLSGKRGEVAQEEPEFLDSEDEAEYREQQAEEAEKEAEWTLTPGQKFRKEWKSCWTGNVKKAEKEKEKAAREERRKVAREVVREMMRLQKKGNKIALPEYSKQA